MARTPVARKLARRYLSARIAPAILDDLDRRARRLRKPRSNLVEQYIAEGLKLDAHPGIAFVDGPAGRRPVLASHRGLDVWEVVTTLQANDGSVADTAALLVIPEAEVRVALSYYAANRQEIDEWIAANDALATELETAWRKEQSALR